MKAFLALIRKQLHETRTMMALSAAAMFALGWLFVFVTSLNETEILKVLASDTEGSRFRWMRAMGLDEQPPSISLILSFWSHPFIILTLAIWAIGRGSMAVGAEVERGTLDLLLSRPISRSSYLLSHVLVALAGLCLIAMGLVAGTIVATHYNALRVPPMSTMLLRPGLNFAALGLPIYGYTLLVSSLDHVRWRSTMIGAVLTLIGFVAWVVSLIPVIRKNEWHIWLERISIFKLYDPIDAASLGRNLMILSGLGILFISLAFVGFCRRDLPANG